MITTEFNTTVVCNLPYWYTCCQFIIYKLQFAFISIIDVINNKLGRPYQAHLYSGCVKESGGGDDAASVTREHGEGGSFKRNMISCRTPAS